MAEKGKRQANFELLRIVAMCFIITLHFLGHGGILEADGQSAWFHAAVTLIQSFANCAVNIYVLISGYFLVKSRFSWKKVFLTLAQVWFYSVFLYLIICAKDAFLDHTPSFSLTQFFKTKFFPVITGQYWFVTAYMILYILSPFLNLFFQRITKKTHQFFIGVSAVLFSVIPSIFTGIADDMFLQRSGFTFVWFFVLYGIAAYFRLYGIPRIAKWKLALTYFIAGLCPPGIIVLQRLAGKLLRGRDIFWIKWNLYDSLPILVCSIAVFLFFAQVEINGKTISRIILWLASHSFAVYLIHDSSSLRMPLWTTIGTTRFINSPMVFLALPITVISIYLACCLIDQVRAWLFIPLQRSKRLNALFAKLDAKTNAMLSPTASPDGSDG